MHNCRVVCCCFFVSFYGDVVDTNVSLIIIIIIIITGQNPFAVTYDSAPGGRFARSTLMTTNKSQSQPYT